MNYIALTFIDILPVVGDNLPENIQYRHIEQVEDKCRLPVQLPEVVSHPVRLFDQDALQSLLSKPKVL